MPAVKDVLAQAGTALTPQVEGTGSLPAEGAAIVAFNHVSPTDAVVARLAEGRRVYFTGAKESTTSRGWFGRRSRAASPASDDEQLAQARKVIARGDLLGIFPEGDRSPDGSLHRGGSLMARLVLATGAPVVPVAVVGQGNLAMPRLVVGDALDLTRFLEADRLPMPVRLDAITDTVMAALLELSGQHYVDVRAGEHRQALASERNQAREAARAAAAARKAAEAARIEQRRADRAAEAAELAAAQAFAAQAAREQARRAAEADRRRREAVRATRIPARDRGQVRDLREPGHHDPLG